MVGISTVQISCSGDVVPVSKQRYNQLIIQKSLGRENEHKNLLFYNYYDSYRMVWVFASKRWGVLI